MNVGFFKKNNNDRIEGYNNTENIQHNNMKLNQFLKKITTNLSQLIHLNRYMSAYIKFNDMTLTKDENRIEPSGINTNLADGNFFDIVNDSQLKLKTEREFLLIDVSCLVISTTPDSRFLWVSVERDGREIYSDNTSAFINQRGQIRLLTSYQARLNDIIKVQIVGKNGDIFTRLYCNVTASYKDKNFERYL